MAAPSVQLDYYPLSGAVMIVASEAGECGRCHVARLNFVCRAGTVACLVCDSEAEQIRLWLLESCVKGAC